MTRPNDPLILSKFLIKFYKDTIGKEVCDVSEIPAESLTLMLHMRYVDIITPYVIEDHKKQLSLRFLSTRYGVGVRVIRTIVSTQTQTPVKIF